MCFLEVLAAKLPDLSLILTTYVVEGESQLQFAFDFYTYSMAHVYSNPNK